MSSRPLTSALPAQAMTIESPAASRTPWARLATGAVSFVALLVVVCFLAGTAPDADLWGHLTFGRDIVQTGWVHTSDPYSFASDQPWINHEWLAEVVMWSAYSVGGAPGLVALKLFMACIAGIALLETWRPRGLSGARRDAMVFVTALSTWPVLATMRPQAFSVAFFGVLLLTLDRVRSGGRRWLVALPLIFALWVNTHGGWIVGAGVLAVVVACSWFDPAWSNRDRLLLFATACASALATLCNPYGPAMLGFLVETVRPARTDIVEWQSAAHLPAVAFLLWLVPTLVGAQVLWRSDRSSRPPLSSLIVVALLAVGSFRVIRLVGFYSLAVGFLIVPSIRSVVASAPVVPSPRGWMRMAAACVALVAIAVVIFGRTLTMDAEWLPEREAAVYVKTHDVRGRLLTWFDYGEFAIWHFSPAVRVSMDGRRETVYSEEMRERHRRIYMNTPEALDEVARLNPDYVWLPAPFPVVPRLEASGWHRVFSGPRSVILSKRIDDVVAIARTDPTLPARVFPGP